MATHEQRVVDELDELNLKVHYIESFIISDVFKSLNPVDRSLLIQQQACMETYCLILNQRISRF